MRGGFSLGGKHTIITSMFCDIRNFTARCADCSATEIVSILNLFFEEMVSLVEGTGSEVRVVEVQLENGETVVVPRANVEILEL